MSAFLTAAGRFAALEHSTFVSFNNMTECLMSFVWFDFGIGLLHMLPLKRKKKNPDNFRVEMGKQRPGWLRGC